MERSRNLDVVPMKGTIERETKRKALAAKATRLVVQSLQRHTAEPFPAMSDHYRIPGEIGSVLLPSQMEFDYTTPPAVLDDSRVGFDSEGNYHSPSLRTEHIERPVQLDGSWEL